MAKELDKFYQYKWREQFFDKFNLIESKHAVELEKAVKKAKRQTKKEAKIEAKQETLLETAKNLLALNININNIVKATGLSEKTILSLK